MCNFWNVIDPFFLGYDCSVWGYWLGDAIVRCGIMVVETRLIASLPLYPRVSPLYPHISHYPPRVHPSPHVSVSLFRRLPCAPPVFPYRVPIVLRSAFPRHVPNIIATGVFAIANWRRYCQCIWKCTPIRAGRV